MYTSEVYHGAFWRYIVLILDNSKVQFNKLEFAYQRKSIKMTDQSSLILSIALCLFMYMYKEFPSWNSNDLELCEAKTFLW